MSLLFTVDNKIVRPTTQVLLLSPFKEIWERDKSSTKQYAIEDFTYIEFVVSAQKSNPFSGYSEDERPGKVKESVITRNNWKEDKLIKEGMKALLKFQRESSITYNYYMSAKTAAEKMNNFFQTIDITTYVNPKTGLPIYKPKDITSALNDTSRVLENLSNLREKVDNEIFEEIKTRGQKIVSPFADPNTL